MAGGSRNLTLRSLPRIERLELAVLELQEGHPAASAGRSVPVYGYLIDHPDGPILVDTGIDERVERHAVHRRW
jgi:hypothetical protein